LAISWGATERVILTQGNSRQRPAQYPTNKQIGNDFVSIEATLIVFVQMKWWSVILFIDRPPSWPPQFRNTASHG
jgi:hypothetical protein